MFSRSIIKYIQSLQHKKFRDEHNAFIAEGPKVVSEFISDRIFECNNIYATQDWISDMPALPGNVATKITRVEAFELEKLSSLSTPNQVIAEFKKKPAINNITLKGKVTLILDDIRDPGNLGTIIRTADWFGIEQIICSHETVDMYNPKVVQSTMASLGRVNIIYTDIREFILANDKVKCYAAVLDGNRIPEMKIKEGIIIIGNESTGIRKEILDMSVEKISIQKTGKAESLNAAVATGIIIHQLMERK